MTRDADFAMPEDTVWSGDIGEALRLAGFHEEFSTDYRPPVTRYRLGPEAGGFYAEFLAPLRGSGVRRDDSPDATVARAGVTAQKLRHMELLLVNPWRVAWGPNVGLALENGAEPLIANPVSFIAQKLLIQGSRPPRTRAQDALYIHDTIELFGDSLEDLGALWRGPVRCSLTGKTARRVENRAIEYTGQASHAFDEAARIPQDRTLDPRRMQQACAYGLRILFGPAA
jgi:hypothetical protein